MTIELHEKMEIAIKNHNISEVKYILDAGYDLDFETNYKWRAIHSAANHGFTEAVDLFYKNGCDIGAKTIYGLTPLILSTWNGHYKTTAYLLSLGQNPYEKSKSGNNSFDYAKRKNDETMLELLKCNSSQCEYLKQTKVINQQRTR